MKNWDRQDSLLAAATVLVAGLVVGLGVMFLRPMTTTVQCDGYAPRWMLEATNYDGGGCAELLPSDAAPANADWTQYCLDLCGCKPGGESFRGVACEALEFVYVTPEPPSFDVSAVRAHFTAECADPVVVDDLFCQEVRIQDMRGEGDTLHVRTTLKGDGYQRAVAICAQLARWHYDSGNDLGYASIAIAKRRGGPTFANRETVTCAVKDP